MTQTLQRFVVRAIEPEVVAGLRVVDDLGNSPRPVVDDEGGSPLRCCLRVSRPGEELLLASYAPLRRWARATGADPGPYDEVGPVFIHATPCGGPVDDGYPAEFRDSPRMLRAYSAQGRILGGTPVEAGGDFETAIDEVVRDERVAVVHARAIEFGCFTFAIHRA
jgi:hypothetical protein